MFDDRSHELSRYTRETALKSQHTEIGMLLDLDGLPISKALPSKSITFGISCLMGEKFVWRLFMRARPCLLNAQFHTAQMILFADVFVAKRLVSVGSLEIQLSSLSSVPSDRKT